MSNQFLELYTSQNGDRWSISWQKDIGRLLVLHEANVPSGGRHTEYRVEDFIARDVGSPQHQALSHLLATVRSS